jgi:large subunit ribosomal protein L28
VLESKKMARCALTGKRRLRANSVSHAKNRAPRWQHPNIQSKRIWVEELQRNVRLSLSTRALKSVSKMGLVAYARKNGLDLAKLVD